MLAELAQTGLGAPKFAPTAPNDLQGGGVAR